MQLNPAKMARPVHADGRRYVPAIDGLRCLAAFGVISAHIGSQFHPTDHLVAYYGAAAYPALIVFFTISGFLVYRPFARAVLAPRPKSETASDRSTNFWVYLLRRVLRIFPLYWTVLFVSVIARSHFPPGGIHQPPQLHGLTDWVQAIFLLPFPHPMRLLAGPLGIAMWTLAIELPFYVVVPLYSLAIKAIQRRMPRGTDPFKVLVAGPLVLIAFIFSLGLIFGGELAFPVMSLPTGMLFAVLETRQSLSRRRYPLIRVLSDNWWICIVGYVALVFVGAHLALDAYHSSEAVALAAQGRRLDPYDKIRNYYFPMQMAMALLIFIPVAFGKRRSLFVRAMAAAPLQMLAPLTYGIYLWHVPLIEYTKEWYGQGFLGFPFIGTHGFGMPTLFIAVGLAITTFLLVEFPASKLRDTVDRWSRGHHQGRPDPVGADASGTTEREEVLVDAARHAEHLDEPLDEPRRPAGGAPRRPAPKGRRPDGRSTAAVRPERSARPNSDRRPDRPDRPRRPAPGGARSAVATAAAPAATEQLATPWCEPLDGFRAICACIAVMGHTFLAASLYPFVGALHALGILVALFFAISAYVLYQPFLEADVRRLPRPKAGSFYFRRLLRIYPLFALALTAYLVILPEVRPDTWWGYARLYLFLQIFGSELAEHLRGMGSGWYLCNEVIFYLCMPLMALAAARWSNRRRRKEPTERLKAHLAMGWGMVVFGPLLRTLLFALDVPGADYLPLAHLEFFGFGVVVAAYAVGIRLGVEPPALFRWLREHVGLSYALVLVPATALVLLAIVAGNGTLTWDAGALDDRLRFYPYLVAVVLLMAPAALGSARNPTNRWLSGWWFKPLSGLSIHIYLWHQLVLGIMNKVLDREGYRGLDNVDLGPRVLTGAVLVLVALVGTILVARISQPITDWPYEKYRAAKGRMRGRGAAPQPAAMRPTHPRALEPHPS